MLKQNESNRCDPQNRIYTVGRKEPGRTHRKNAGRQIDKKAHSEENKFYKKTYRPTSYEMDRIKKITRKNEYKGLGVGEHGIFK